MSTFRSLRPLVLSLAIALAACVSDAGTAPSTLTAGAPSRAIGTLGSVFTLQLRAIPTDPIFPTDPLYGYGNLQIRLGSLVDQTCLPPNPITPQPGYTLLSVCGRIFNEGGALYRGGAIYRGDLSGDGVIVVAEFGGAHPVDSCRRYDIAGASVVPSSIAQDMVANPTSYLVLMNGDVSGSTTRIGGALDGTAWGPVGTRPETDPYFAARACDVAITP